MIESNKRTFIAGSAALARRVLVKLASSVLVVNTKTSTDLPIGVTEYAADASEAVAIRLLNAGGTVELVAAGAISADAVVYAADDGEIQALPSAAGTYLQIGIALEAASADQDIIEVLPWDVGQTKTVT